VGCTGWIQVFSVSEYELEEGLRRPSAQIPRPKSQDPNSKTFVQSFLNFKFGFWVIDKIILPFNGIIINFMLPP
jgi:hypothetical protein